MGKTYRNVKAPSDSVSMFGSPHNRGFARTKKRHSHHSIRSQNKNKNINEDNFQTHFTHKKVNEFKVIDNKIGNIPNISWINIDDRTDFDKWTKEDGNIFQTIDKKIDDIKNSSEPPQCRSCYTNYKERYLNYTKKQLERRGKIGMFKGHRS
tara:strand:- start:190 stop:645 length:456 start_codon:yes stop_codon:yes gene_type:complete